MTIEEITFLDFAFAAATLAAMTYERRMDVLYGPLRSGPRRSHGPFSGSIVEADTFDRQSLSLESPQHALPNIRDRV